MTWTPTTLNIQDASGTSRPVIAYTDGTNFSFAHPLLDNTGAVIAPATSGNQTSANTSLTAIAASVAAATPAGTNIMGKVGIDQTTPGTTNGVQLNAALPAGSNVIGKVTTDQTTHGTTDLVAADITKVAGSAISQGHGTAASAIRVELPTDGTGMVGLAAGTNSIGTVVNAAPRVVAGNTTTRPANTTTYASGQLLANSTTAGSVVPATIAVASGTNVAGSILRMKLLKSSSGVSNAVFRIHLFNAQPTVANGDGGPFVPSLSASYMGSFDVTVNVSDTVTPAAMGVGVPTQGAAVNFTPVSGATTLYYLIEVRAAYTPVSGEVFTPYAELAQ